MAIAASNMTAALGYVICDKAKKDDVPCSRYRAHRDWRYNPKAAVEPDHKMTSVPNKIPICDIANGIASVPAPITIKPVSHDTQVAVVGKGEYENIEGFFRVL